MYIYKEVNRAFERTSIFCCRLEKSIIIDEHQHYCTASLANWDVSTTFLCSLIYYLFNLEKCVCKCIVYIVYYRYMIVNVNLLNTIQLHSNFVVFKHNKSQDQTQNHKDEFAV